MQISINTEVHLGTVRVVSRDQKANVSNVLEVSL